MLRNVSWESITTAWNFGTDVSLLVKKLRKSRERIRQEGGKCEGRKGYKETERGAEILREIRRLRRRRKGRVRMTFNEIAENLNEQGYTAAHGKPFTGNTVRGILHRQKKRSKNQAFVIFKKS